MSEDTRGGITVSIDVDDIQQLMKQGRSMVTKEVGPIQVKIRCDDKMYAKVITQTRDGESGVLE